MPDPNEQVFLAIDLGAESGRVVAGSLEDGAITLTVVHRFPNGPVKTDTGLHWNFTNSYDQILLGLNLAADRWGERIVSIGVDTWGVDYGLVNAEGELLNEPFHYRDSRTDGMQDVAFKAVPRRDIYETTGIQFLAFNTLYQLLAEARTHTPDYQEATKLLFIPDLINQRLTGRITHELTIASTSQFIDAQTRHWATSLLNKLKLRVDLLGDLIEPGDLIGTLTQTVAEYTGLPNDVKVVAVGSHDTASAVAAVPACGGGWAYLSSGTWSLMGVETTQPIINDLSYEHGFTNEAGVQGTTRLLKNISGLWLLQECRRQWQRDGCDYTYAQLAELAEQAPPFARHINADDPAFAAPNDMPNRIDHHLKTSGQSPCDNHAQMARTILESLALRYRDVLDTLEKLTGQTLHTLHIVGGGSQNRLLNQFTANATGRTVVAGPVEATALGNILMQLIAAGQVNNLAEGRKLIAVSFPTESFSPTDTQRWTEQPSQ